MERVDGDAEEVSGEIKWVDRLDERWMEGVAQDKHRGVDNQCEWSLVPE